MTKPLTAAGLLVAVLLGLADARAPDDAAPDDVSALVKALAARRDIAAPAADLAGRRELVEVMRAFRPKGKDALDRRLARLAAKPLDAATVRADRDDLLHLARLSRAAAAVAKHFAPARPTPGLGPRQWQGHAADMDKAARGLEAAAAARDAAKVRAAAVRLNNACNNCHADFDAAARPTLSALVLGLADDIARGADTAEPADRVRARHTDLADVMALFKPREKGGVGYGQKGLGIEATLAALAKGELAKETLPKEKDDLLRMTNVTLAVAEVTARYGPWRPRQAAQLTGWKRRVGALKATARELKDAVRDEKPAAVRAAARATAEACRACHDLYR